MKNNDIFCVETITSKTNSTIVKIAKLLDKKYRKDILDCMSLIDKLQESDGDINA